MTGTGGETLPSCDGCRPNDGRFFTRKRPGVALGVPIGVADLLEDAMTRKEAGCVGSARVFGCSCAGCCVVFEQGLEAKHKAGGWTDQKSDG